MSSTVASWYPRLRLEASYEGPDDPNRVRDLRVWVDDELWSVYGFRVGGDLDEGYVLATFVTDAHNIIVRGSDDPRDDDPELVVPSAISKKPTVPMLDVWFAGPPFLSSITGCRINGRMRAVQDVKILYSPREDARLEFSLKVISIGGEQ